MRELSLHVLDIVENSINAGADRVVVRIGMDSEKDRLTIAIEDNGKGMGESVKKKVLDPFITTKPEKKIGLGLSMLSEAARRAGGEMHVESNPGSGTVVEATFGLSHVDRQPMGDMAETMVMLIVGNPDVEFRVEAVRNSTGFFWDTDSLREKFGDASRTDPDVIDSMREALHFLKQE